ncbi:hypothetical protein BN126360227 [Stenotrophomonas indicatrix]|nr:hypothetical protein BN126360227 [Stenotrophomonas indicatrix]
MREFVDQIGVEDMCHHAHPQLQLLQRDRLWQYLHIQRFSNGSAYRAGRAHSRQQSVYAHGAHDFDRAAEHRPEARQPSSVLLHRTLRSFDIALQPHRCFAGKEAQGSRGRVVECIERIGGYRQEEGSIVPRAPEPGKSGMLDRRPKGRKLDLCCSRLTRMTSVTPTSAICVVGCLVGRLMPCSRPCKPKSRGKPTASACSATGWIHHA